MFDSSAETAEQPLPPFKKAEQPFNHPWPDNISRWKRQLIEDATGRKRPTLNPVRLKDVGVILPNYEPQQIHPNGKTEIPMQSQSFVLHWAYYWMQVTQSEVMGLGSNFIDNEVNQFCLASLIKQIYKNGEYSGGIERLY